jgi:hypothetical protein
VRHFASILAVSLCVASLPAAAQQVMVTVSATIKELMKTYVKYPPRKLQSESYSGPITLTQYERFQYLRDSLENKGINLPLPTGN